MLLIIVVAMEEINKILVNKYNLLLNDLMIGHSINSEQTSELICLIHMLHFLSFDKENSKLQLSLLAYYV